MNYELRGSNDICHITDSIFVNNGIEDIDTYTHLTDDVIIPYDKLDNIDKAVECFDKHISNNDTVTLIVDCDVDGQCSSALVYMYIRKNNKEIPIHYLIHSGKQHGLSPDIMIPDDTKLLIIPDAGSNDVEQCKELSEKGIDIIILDHHEIEKDNPYAIVVNNQGSQNYINKELCGTGIVYKFLQALDDLHWTDIADCYLDLVALANISDIMDIRSYETKRLIDKGLNMINNKCFEEFINSQNFSMKGKVNPHTIAFCITSLMNAMCRVGNSEEKDLLFRAFIESDEIFEYKKRGEPTPIEETIYQRAVRLCKNAKARQDKQVNKIVPSLLDKCQNSDNAILFVKGNSIPSTFTGLVAMKLADKCKKPCLILRECNEEDKKVYRGSARNFDKSYIGDLKQFLSDTDKFNWCQGHGNAFGFEINAENVKATIDICNTECESCDKNIPVDFAIGYSDFNVSMIADVHSLEDYYGTGIKEPTFYISNIPLEHNQGSILGKTGSTWKFITDDNIAIIKFGNNENDSVIQFLDDYNDNTLYINAFCKLEISEYMSVITPQIRVEQYEVINE